MDNCASRKRKSWKWENCSEVSGGASAPIPLAPPNLFGAGTEKILPIAVLTHSQCVYLEGTGYWAIQRGCLAGHCTFYLLPSPGSGLFNHIRNVPFPSCDIYFDKLHVASWHDCCPNLSSSKLLTVLILVARLQSIRGLRCLGSTRFKKLCRY